MAVPGVTGSIGSLQIPRGCVCKLQVSNHGLREGCEWWGAELNVLPYALVLDFVFSDSALQAWDNNGQQVCSGLTQDTAVVPEAKFLQTRHPSAPMEAPSSSGQQMRTHPFVPASVRSLKRPFKLSII